MGRSFGAWVGGQDTIGPRKVRCRNIGENRRNGSRRRKGMES